MIYSKAKEVPSRIHSAVVTDVKPDRGLCTVVTTDLTGRIYVDIPYSTGYLSPDGAGIDICPERGSYCYVLARTSDSMSDNDSEASVIAFRSPREGDSNLGSRIKLLPGDIRLSTVGGNEILLRKNGDMYLFSGASSSLSFVSSEEIVKQISPSYEHEMLAGNVSWQVNGSVAGGPTSCRYGVKRFSSDDNPYLELLAGETVSGGLNISMYIDGSSRDLTFELDVDNQGIATMFFKTSLNLSANESVSLYSKDTVVQGANSATLSSSMASVSVSPNKVTINADVIEIFAKQFIVSNYGGNMLTTSSEPNDVPRNMLTSDLFEFIKTHKHDVTPPDPITSKQFAIPSTELASVDVELFQTKQSKLL